jgi:hypothetical protein
VKVAKCFERGETLELAALLAAVRVEILTPAFAAVRGELRIDVAQRRKLGLRDREVIHQLGAAKSRDGGREPGRVARAVFGYRLDVDVERIEKQPAARRVRAAGAPPVVEPRVQRIEPDTGAAELRHDLQQIGEIGKIAVAPIAA